eukprot:scaffold296812_cov42-Prasinocladus_malaysianus.AAC.3
MAGAFVVFLSVERGIFSSEVATIRATGLRTPVTSVQFVWHQLYRMTTYCKEFGVRWPPLLSVSATQKNLVALLSFASSSQNFERAFRRSPSSCSPISINRQLTAQRSL